MKRILGLNGAWLLATVMLFVAIVGPPTEIWRRHTTPSRQLFSSGHHSHAPGFYTLLRWVCCGVFTYSMVVTFQMKRVSWGGIFAALAVLFNPVAPVYLQRYTWQIVDCAAIGVMLVAAVMFWRTGKQSTS